METEFQTPAEAALALLDKIWPILINFDCASALDRNNIEETDILSLLTSLKDELKLNRANILADAIQAIYEKVSYNERLGGMNISQTTVLDEGQYREILFLADAWMESARQQSRQDEHTKRSWLAPTAGQSSRTPMTLTQKILLHHAKSANQLDDLRVGTVVRVSVDWILASELSWEGMAQTYSTMKRPPIWRNDRFWLAGDHVVHPSLVDTPKIEAFIESAQKAKRDFRMTEYQGMNYTIMHTEFVRERAQPGMVILGADSHTCSAGAVGSLAIGLGSDDVMMALVLGETWIKIPEAVRIDLIGEPKPHITGKDVILHILKVLKRNTIAAERVVEFGGSGAVYLSSDARFAICNMCAELGAISGIFVPDHVTQTYVNSRKHPRNKAHSSFFHPYQGAIYAGSYTIELADVESTIALYPSPDNVVPISERQGMALDGVFIGACTTTEEELVLAAVLLRAGLNMGLPLMPGKRHFVPGSLPIVDKLERLGLLEVYKEAGFTQGPPGCSLCVGISAEKALSGEIWLSSQNRNFQNRMGTGSFGHLSSALVCAASSFSMTLVSPEEFLTYMDFVFFKSYKDSEGGPSLSPQPVAYQEPVSLLTKVQRFSLDSTTTLEEPSLDNQINVIKSKVVRLGDFIDTDAMAPGEALTTCTTDEEFGKYCLKHTHPNFRHQVQSGQQIVVAGEAFGCGSSRQCAVSALLGAGVKVVIAKSFSFIFARNQYSLGLLGIVMQDDTFFQQATDGTNMTIDVEQRIISVDGNNFDFQLSDIEFNLIKNKGLVPAYDRFRGAIWTELAKTVSSQTRAIEDTMHPVDARLEW